MKIGIHGINGKMGLACAKEILQHPDLTLVSASVRNGHNWAEKRLDEMGIINSPIRVTTNLEQLCAAADVIIDFTRPDATQNLIGICKKLKKAMVIGTTGFNDLALQWIERASAEIPIVLASNTSVGVVILQELTKKVAEILDYHQWDIDIDEAHHRNKIDAPSGTALRLGQIAAIAQKTDFESRKCYPYTNKRKIGDIGFSVRRAGEIIGDHTISFTSDFETISLSHHAKDRRIFAQGALLAAKWLNNRPAGLYQMSQVLGFNS